MVLQKGLGKCARSVHAKRYDAKVTNNVQLDVRHIIERQRQRPSYEFRIVLLAVRRDYGGARCGVQSLRNVCARKLHANFARLVIYILLYIYIYIHAQIISTLKTFIYVYIYIYILFVLWHNFAQARNMKSQNVNSTPKSKMSIS